MHVISVQFPVLETQSQLLVLTIHFSFVQPFWFSQLFVQDVLQPVFEQPVLVSPPKIYAISNESNVSWENILKGFLSLFFIFLIFLLIFMQIYKTFYIIIRKKSEKISQILQLFFHNFCKYVIINKKKINIFLFILLYRMPFSILKDTIIITGTNLICCIVFQFCCIR